MGASLGLTIVAAIGLIAREANANFVIKSSKYVSSANIALAQCLQGRFHYLTNCFISRFILRGKYVTNLPMRQEFEV